MAAPLFVVKRARGFLRSFPLQSDRAFSLSLCTTKVEQKNESTKSKPLFSNVLATFSRPRRIFFSTTEKSLSEEEGEAILRGGEPPAYHTSLPFLCASSQSHVGVLALAEKFWG